MNKILLGTTALVALVAGSAMADGPSVTVGGKMKFEAGFDDQKDGYKGNSRDTNLLEDTKINVKVNGKADNGLAYGAVIELQADVSRPNDNTGTNADKTYLFLESGLGRVEMGSNYGPSKTLKVDASTFARATGGVDGDWYYFVNTAIPVAPGSRFLTSTDLPIDAGIIQRGDTENANKITYYSPRYAGLQFGVSFIPDSGARGTSNGFSANNNLGQYENVFDLGLNYTGQFNQFGISASATSQLGDAEVPTQKNLRAYAAGASVSYAGFTLGGSYTDWIDSGMLKTTASKDAKLWTIGGAYVQGPVGVSVSYLNSKYQKNDFDNIAVGADYQLAPGFVPYAEVSFFDLESAQANVAKNNGTVFILGTQLNF